MTYGSILCYPCMHQHQRLFLLQVNPLQLHQTFYCLGSYSHIEEWSVDLIHPQKLSVQLFQFSNVTDGIVYTIVTSLEIAWYDKRTHYVSTR